MDMDNNKNLKSYIHKLGERIEVIDKEIADLEKLRLIREAEAILVENTPELTSEETRKWGTILENGLKMRRATSKLLVAFLSDQMAIRKEDKKMYQKQIKEAIHDITYRKCAQKI